MVPGVREPFFYEPPHLRVGSAFVRRMDLWLVDG